MKNLNNKSEATNTFARLETAAHRHTARALHRTPATSLMIMVVTACGRADESSEATKPQPVQELFQTDLVFPQEAGEFQLTLAPAFRRERGADVSEIPVSVEYGLTDAWQMEVEWSTFKHRNPKIGRTTRGIGDLELGTQYSFLNIGGSSFHAAPRFSVQLPLGSMNKELTEGFVEYEPSLILARDFPALHNVQLFAQVGLALVQRVKEPADARDREPAAHEFAWSTGFFAPFTHWVGSVELSGSNNRWNHGGEDNQMYLTPGCVWKISRSAEIGVGVPVGLNRGSDRFGIITQLIYEF